MTTPNYNRTKFACYAAYFTMSSIFSLPPLLFVTFHQMYGISYTLLGTLVLINFCTQLAVDLAISRGAEHITIIGGLDGRLDHPLSNLAILEDLDRRGIHAVITDGRNRVRFLRNNSTLIPRSGFRYLALIAADETVKGVSIEGVKYPLKRARLHRAHQYAVSNEIEKNCALIEVRKGGVWILESAEAPSAEPPKKK